ncbi:MAG: hypothetical protein M3209_12825 [Acidobacteriota bacterium]|nr:hypothetical protein [Acidobacteriota bacterium]
MFKIKIFLLGTLLLTFGFAVFSQSKDNITSWKQYSSSMAGFKVKYPSDWRAEEQTYDRVWHTIFISPGVKDYDVIMTSSIVICSQPKNWVSNSSNSRSGCRQRDDHLSDVAKDKVVSEETIEINGLKIRKKVTEDKYRSDTTYIYAFLSTKEREFLVSSGFPKRFNLDRYIPIFDQMLATIQLLEDRTVLTYRNEKYDFAITYPTTWKSCLTNKTAKSDEEEFFVLVPEGKLCNGGNYISVSRSAKFSNEKNNRDLKEFLKGKDFTKIIPYVEFKNIHAALGEKIDGNYIRRERYFYTNYPETYELLKISEMYEINQEDYQNEANEILATARRFLKN